ncbi:hypothetical protein GH714_019960 [Hevea brasiliensis]|uniref:Integrase catalytic domain-containing protein n=1 Tax=Hevea brasiliensis TaxID=3981 RepID=A0A6A6MXI4_HEVBR|nr:hypothetical protein GH714_019960 [Hevea brasiliensis]
MGPWNGKIDFTISPLDDFEVLIGMEFLKKARAVPVLVANCLLLMGNKPCVVPTTFSPINEKKLISALQFKKEVKCREPPFSKYGTFIPMSKYCLAEDITCAFFKYVVKYWGVPKSIVSDRDGRFARSFWAELFHLLGSRLDVSTSFHPQTDGQTERFNGLLEEYLRHFVNASEKNWASLLDVAQFYFNSLKSSTTNKSPFEIVTSQQPLVPHTLDGP